MISAAMKTLLTILCCLSVPLIAADKNPLTKEESAKIIEAAIRKAVNKPTGELAELDFNKVHVLSLFNSGITDITPLSRLVNLKKLNVGQSPLKNLSPLAELVHLEELAIGNYGTPDRFKVPLNLEPLKGLVKLKRLEIVGSHVRDLSPVGNLPDITYLALAYSRVDDYQPLLTLKHLKGLQLEGNGTAKANLKIVAKLPELTFLKLQACRIDDLSPLQPLTKLEHIHLDSNQITNLTPLEDMAALRILDLYNNKVTDARPLIRLIGMEIVRLGRNPITNFAPLNNLGKLKILEVDRQKLNEPSLMGIKRFNPKLLIRGVN